MGGVPISHNALQHFPEYHEAAGGTRSGTPPRGVPRPPGGTPRGVPRPGGTWPPQGTRTLGGTRTPRGVPRPPPGGYPDPGGSRVQVPPWGGPGTPQGGYRVRGLVPPRRGSGTPPGQDRSSTHYTAGGMPLAFTQEDFLVYFTL